MRMVDNVNPTSQFHPYTPTDAIPQSERENPSGLSSVLDKLGIDKSSLDGVTDRLKSLDVKQSLGTVRDFARSKPAIALGGLAVAAIGAGLLRKR